MHTIPLHILALEQQGYHILVEVKLFDTIHKMVVDTGASKTVFDKSMLFQAGMTETALITSNILSTGLGTNAMESHTFHLENFSIADWLCSPIEVAVLDLSTINYAYTQMGISPIIGVLGGDILLQYGGIINYKKRTLTLNKHRRKQAYK
ncbi:Aspartyl protease [Sphingobacterium nematocida]|uniref:Aspartyl protease n=1 Tax=Sphingobacterium nematocida TaxID=1513896 RepID=A0A1T5FSD9_9SPHI|nr:retropepsin-like aspartic protease [Sphingobacterium nematocida]SKB99040.1 Aspartyl protease [Sphingobacterium nematocida]